MNKPRAARKAPLSRRMNWASVVVLFSVHASAFYALFFTSPARWVIGTCLALHFVTGGLGLGIGYHRLLSHRSFRAKLWLENLLATFGTLSMQVGPLSWAAMHRSHHAYEDQLGDPHSAKRGFLWSHIAWIFVKAPNGYRYAPAQKSVPDLAKNAYLVWLDRYCRHLNLALFGVSIAVFGLTTSLWLFPLRWVAVWHSVWLINSLAHRNEEKGESTSVNSWWIAFLTYGEGWHRNHHLSPLSVSNQKRWYQLDLNYGIIRLMSFFGWAEIKKKRVETKSGIDFSRARLTTARRRMDPKKRRMS